MPLEVPARLCVMLLLTETRAGTLTVRETPIQNNGDDTRLVATWDGKKRKKNTKQEL